jgi:hypothetical protein
MDAQVPPDTLSTQDENKLICEKLLGLKWTWIPHASLFIWADDDRQTFSCIRKFDTWAEAGLILEALISHCPTLEYSDGKWDCYGGDPFESFFHAYADTAPLAIRAAALEHIKAVKS